MFEWIFDSYWYWFSLAVLLLVLEVLIPGIFLLWLGMGAALVGFFLLLFPQASLAWQLFVLALSIGVAVTLGLKWQKKLLKTQPSTLNLGLEGYLGRTATVSQSFHQGHGRVSIDGSSFPAVCQEEQLEEGQRVEVTGVQDSVFLVTGKQANT